MTHAEGGRGRSRRRRGGLPLKVLLALALLSLTAGCAGTGHPDPRKMTFPEVRLEPPEHRRVELPSGTVLFLLEDHEVPLVNVQVLIRTGSVLEPSGKAGLAEIMGRVLRTGGTRTYPAQLLNETVEGMGAILETSVGREAGRASLSVLSPDLERGLDLLAEVLRYPAFSEEDVERARERKIEEIRRSNDDPDTIAFRELRAAVYGEDPRGRSPTPEGVSSMSRVDLVEFHRRFFHPDRIIVGVSGDFTEENLLLLWEKSFGGWKPAGGPPEAFPLPEESPPPALYLVPRGFPQTTFVLGHLAPALGSPEYYPFTLMNYILGGAGFNSRLTEVIRSNRGLAYSVGSWYRGGVGYGVLTAWCKTAGERFPEALRLMLDVMEEMRLEGVKAEELHWAKEAIINNHIFSIDRTAEVVARRMAHEYNGLPEDFLERYPDRIAAVTKDEVNRAAASYLRPLGAAVVVVGIAGGLEEPFEGFGDVKVVPLREF